MESKTLYYLTANDFEARSRGKAYSHSFSECVSLEVGVEVKEDIFCFVEVSGTAIGA